MEIKKIGKDSENINRFTDIIYKNFLDLTNYNAGHDKDRIRKLLLSNDSENYYLLVKGKIVAYIITQNYIINTGTRSNHISYLYVSSKHRGNGYSKILLKYLMEKKAKEGHSHLMLSVKKNNLIAQALYKKFGFVRFMDDIDRRMMVLIYDF